jgi:hypothetical protein
VALIWVSDLGEADETASGGKTLGEGTLGREKAAQGHAEVFGLRHLKHGEHALASRGRDLAGRNNLFSQSIYARGARDQKQTEAGFAAEPARPLEAAMIHGRVKAVTGERIGDHAG